MSRTVDIQLDVVALVRSREEADDLGFHELVKGKSKEELRELLSASAALTAMVIGELLEKLRMALSGTVDGEIPKVTVTEFLDGIIKEIFTND